MKRITIALSLLLMSFLTFAQDHDVAALSIRVQQPEREYLTASSCRLLQTKMTQMLTHNGISKDMPSNRFVMTAKANVLNKDIIAGSPSRISEQIELTFIIGDVLENIKYGTYILNLTGIGLNEEQAIQQAIKTVKVNDPGMSQFIDQSKAKIVAYYRENEAKIIRDAELLVSQGCYDEAVYSLAMIPDACGSCYEHCRDKMLEINQQRIDHEGESLLSQAKAAWAKSPNANGAKEVYPLIADINPAASCYKQVDPFLKQITNKLVADDRRAWEFKMKQYEDEKAREQRDFEARVAKEQREFEARVAKEQRDFDAQQAREARNAAIRKQEIEAARQVAVEYARNQPDVVSYNTTNTILLW
ncbi:MAG: hypothetical protein IKH24_03890 [Bacteroidales bacterium]|nr:hypothetical protein [Bacteroidales bacterium]